MMHHCRNCSRRMPADHPRIEVRTATGVDVTFCSIECYRREELGQVGGARLHRLFDDLETRLGRRALEEGQV